MLYAARPEAFETSDVFVADGGRQRGAALDVFRTSCAVGAAPRPQRSGEEALDDELEGSSVGFLVYEKKGSSEKSRDRHTQIQTTASLA